MTREKEDELLARRRELREKAHEMIQRIVEARIKGERDADAVPRQHQWHRFEVVI